MSKTDAAKKQTSFVLRYAIQSFGLILVLALLIRLFFISSYVMSGQSMLPSIWPGDFLLGYKWQISEPRRGEVLVLRCPHQSEPICLKRVVGVGGDRIEINAGNLVINGKPVRFKALGDFGQETVEGASWPIWPEAHSKSNQEALIVPPHYVYVLNDRRQNQEDSRQFGPLPVELVEARVGRIWLSLDWSLPSGDVRSWPRVRWSRLFRSID